jgi:hypothetical protein
MTATVALSFEGDFEDPREQPETDGGDGPAVVGPEAGSSARSDSRYFGPAEAVRIGVVNELAAPDELMEQSGGVRAQARASLAGLAADS